MKNPVHSPRHLRISFAAVLFFLFFTSLSLSGRDEIPVDVKKVLTKHGCLTCHAVSVRLIGPSFRIIAIRQYTADKLEKLMANPQPSNWPGYPPMLPIQNISRGEVEIIAAWMKDLNTVVTR